MKSLVALIHREYLEHKGAFLFAPLIILAILTLMLLGSLASNRFHIAYEFGAISPQIFFEFAFIAVSALWFLYLMAALFFYYADAFNADRRNNSMLFWKSMPVSDFKVLSAKMLAGMTVFPALIFIASLLSGLLIYLAGSVAMAAMPGLVLPPVVTVAGIAWQVMSFTFVYLVIAILWYAPFLAWVGALSTAVGRWAIPLAFLVPALLGLAENLILGRSTEGPGFILSYLRQRIHPPEAHGPGSFESLFDRTSVADPGRFIAQLLAGVDWTQLAGGLIVAAILVFLASEYRRRFIAT